MVNICQLCGDRGFSNALIECEKCDAYSIHRYCLHELPKTLDEYVTWFCVDCEPTKPTLGKSKVLTPEKSISGSPKEQRWNQSEKNLKRKAKKKAKGESEGLAKSIANAEFSVSKGRPPNRDDACEGTKGEKQMELDQEDEAKSIENTSRFLSHGQSSAEPFVDPIWRESLPVSDRKTMNKLKKKVKDQSERVNKSTTNVELSKRLGSPPNNLLIETHSGVNCEATKGKRQMEIYQEDGAISLENTSYFLSHGQSSAQTHVDPVDSLHVREKSSMKKGKKKVENESNRVNKSIADAGLSKSQGIPSNNHLIDASFGDTREGAKGEIQMELYHGNSSISTENTSYFLDHGHFSAEPLVDPIWRGSLWLTNKNFGTLGLAAHLSSLACSQAEKEAKLLPTIISAELLYRFDVWPQAFAKCGATDESIAMFFFPAKRQENTFELLIEVMISQDLAMVTEVKNADLLVFTSLSLPEEYHRVFSKFYLWGVFRKKKTSNIRNAVDFRDRRDIGHYGRSHASPLSSYGSF